MAEGASCHGPYREEYIQTNASSNPVGLYHSTQKSPSIFT